MAHTSSLFKVSWIISAGSNISRVPNLLRLYLTQYCILSPEILTGQQEHKNVQEFVSISCHDAFVVDQEAFKHGEWFWFLLAFVCRLHSSIFGPPPTKNEEICIQTLNSSNIDNDIHASAIVDEMDADNDDKDYHDTGDEEKGRW